MGYYLIHTDGKKAKILYFIIYFGGLGVMLQVSYMNEKLKEVHPNPLPKK